MDKINIDEKISSSTFFIKGDKSDYINEDDITVIKINSLIQRL